MIVHGQLDVKHQPTYNLRELAALPSSWRCAREGRVGSGGRVAPRAANAAVAEILGLK